MWLRFSYLTNFRSMFSTPSRFILLFVEQFEKRVDALQQLPFDLHPRAFDQMHRDAAAGAVGLVDARVLDAGYSAGIEDAHPINQRAALRRSFHQGQLTRHRGLPRSYRLVYSISLIIKDGAHRMAPMDFSPMKVNRLYGFAVVAIAIASMTAVASGCGVAYQAGTRIKVTRMSDSLAVGQTSPEVHHAWGEPDLRTYLPGDTEVWSYAY